MLGRDSDKQAKLYQPSLCIAVSSLQGSWGAQQTSWARGSSNTTPTSIQGAETGPVDRSWYTAAR